MPATQRASRASLVKHANGYFDTLQFNNGEIRGTQFAPGATRNENGLAFNDIEAGFRTGRYRFNNRVRDRDCFLVDEVRSAVMCRGYIDHKGVLDEYRLTDGTTTRSVYREPHTWAFFESFKVKDDQITAVEATFTGAPYYIHSPFDKASRSGLRRARRRSPVMKRNRWSSFLDVSLWRDLLLAAGLSLVAAVLAAQFELHEKIFAFTRRWEWLQLDEWPAALLVFACCMGLLYARRHAQLRRALAENRRLVDRVLDVQEQERRRLARELHDELGQYLNAIKLDAQALVDGGAAEGAAQRIAASADHVYGAAATLVRNLRPPALDELGLVAALEACVDTWRRSHPALQVQLSTGGDLEQLGEKVNLAVYRIVQEALTNCVRHARAGCAYIDLTRAPPPDDGLLLEIRDDGAGLPAEVRRSVGGGFVGMRERASLLGGSFELLSAPGQGGVTIRVDIPLAGKNT